MYYEFESFVNSERCKTNGICTYIVLMFESFVNSERCKTERMVSFESERFESFVNSERCKTPSTTTKSPFGLRALLI